MPSALSMPSAPLHALRAGYALCAVLAGCPFADAHSPPLRVFLQIKLIDLGSALYEHDTRSSFAVSRLYRAPEVMLGMTWDGKVDVWSVGCVLYELATGQPLFWGGSVEEVLAAQSAVLGDLPRSLASAADDTIASLCFVKRPTKSQQVLRLRPIAPPAPCPDL